MVTATSRPSRGNHARGRDRPGGRRDVQRCHPGLARKWAAADTLRFHTFSGDIGVRVPAEANASVEFDSFSGDLRSDVPLTFRNKSKHNLKAELNSADGPNAAQLTLQTFSGDVRITKVDPSTGGVHWRTTRMHPAATFRGPRRMAQARGLRRAPPPHLRTPAPFAPRTPHPRTSLPHLSAAPSSAPFAAPLLSC